MLYEVIDLRTNESFIFTIMEKDRSAFKEECLELVHSTVRAITIEEANKKVADGDARHWTGKL